MLRRGSPRSTQAVHPERILNLTNHPGEPVRTLRTSQPDSDANLTEMGDTNE